MDKIQQIREVLEEGLLFSSTIGYAHKKIRKALALIDEMDKKENPCDACQTWDMPEACRYCNKG